ncbi:MAG: 3-phosphoshikimate 1-carboxyvinyltransferase, partial [Frankiaceae bacterium]|nr:3-phosphoshikimate 1-carboxyvinyltransferase [Frankiaceae bacterium]
DDLVVAGNPRALQPTAPAIDLGNAGTVARFLPPVATLAAGDIVFDGDARIRERPVAALLTALRGLGADIDDGGRGAFPLTVHGRAGLAGGDVSVDASSSSQFVTALLLAAPRFTDGITVRHVGSPVPSAPHLEMTVAMLRGAGAVVDDSLPDVWRVEPGVLRAQDLVIEPDLSNAAAFAAAALATAGRVHIHDWARETTQPGALVPGLFARMGATCTFEDGGLTVAGPDRLQGFDADLHEGGELVPVLVALAVLAQSPSRIRGVGHIRLHETDRLAALVAEFSKLGADIAETEDGLVIRPATLHGGVFSTYDDHRLAMAAAVVGLAVPGVLVENVQTTAKTMPDFAQRWSRMVAG